jgi:tungstate transport system substrate-binding protein
VAEGYGIDRRDVMYNDFVIVGPKSDPAGIRGFKDAKEAFRRIKDGRDRNREAPLTSKLSP